MKRRRKLVLLWMLLVAVFCQISGTSANFHPNFNNPNTVIQIKEDTVVGTTVFVLTGNDIENDAMTFSLDTTGNDLFTLGPLNADKISVNLILKKELNRELQDQYQFKAFVTDTPGDSSRIGNQLFYVTVLDANDNAPIFTEQPYRVSVPENTSIDDELITIKAIDADQGANAAVQYRFKNDSSSDIKLITLWKTDKFTIDNLNGKITLTGALDFETTSRYVLSVVAEDRGTPPQKSVATVIIDVTDLSDMPPKFEQSIYITEINENTAKGTSVITVVARDGDTGMDNAINYQIYQGNDGSFAIDPTSGTITVNGSIDAEKTQSYTLFIRASEVPDPSSNATVKVLITVIDKNDNPPLLSQHTYSFGVKEDLAQPGRVITNQLIATDADKTPDYRRFSYSLTGPDSSDFSINPTSGELTFNSTLDYETKINYTFTIVVTETSTAEKYSDNATVLVTLINVNDNVPKFAQSSYNYTSDEEITVGTSIKVITATDDDQGTFGVLTYSLKGEDAEYFNVEANTGNITAAKTLDYENKNTYQFLLIAKDGGGIDYKESSTTINVVLRDVNDNDPVFTHSSYSKGILENLAGGTPVLQMTATDKDSGELGRVSYSIISGNGDDAFAINGSGFISTTKPLDRETTPSYTLTVRAYDNGSPSRNATIDVKVTVLDENDNAPYLINGSDIYVSVSEDKGGGTVILSTIEATDKDEGNNQKLVYEMSGADGRFILNSETGKLQISPTGLDRESKGSYDLVINITDQGIPVRYNVTTVHVEILDVNDNAPEFIPTPSESPNSYIVTVDEGNSTLNAEIIDINATDKDFGKNAQIIYTLTSGDEHSFFHLDNTTGVLTAIKELDRENDQMPKDVSGNGRFFLDIKATDQAEPENLRKSATVRITVLVEDINDNYPTFGSDKYEVTISEATLSGTNVIQVSADDKDLEHKGEVKYNITAGDPQGTFKISPSGYIVIEKTLDAESIATYNLTVTASDGGIPPLTSQVLAVIHVSDVNDNDPNFNGSTYTGSVKENVPKGTPVARVFATDKDEGANGQITYKITNGNQGDAFDINDTTGEIITNSLLDRENIASYTLTVQAEDQGIPSSRKDFAEVVITIEDENDNDPSFINSPYKATILENSPSGTSLTTPTPIKATDSDVGENSKITFSLAGPGSENFVINNTTGIITTSPNSSLDRETKDLYILTVIAIDGGGRNATTNITIDITDVNDVSPRFSTPIFYANVSEDASRNTIVRRVTATDDDLDINKIIIYTSSGADAKFFIDRSTGDIKVDSQLDREFKSLYILNVTAANIIGNVPDGHAQVYITVTDVIDDAPYFNTSVNKQLPEDAPNGTHVAKVTAWDKDVGDTLIYTISSGDINGQFSIDNITGVIRTVKTLDREKTARYTLVIKATDSIGLSASLNVIIDILDVNDNDPVFTRGGLIVDYREQSQLGTSITTVKASDVDEGENSKIRFSIVENIADYIVIDNVTGVVTQGAKVLDREQYSFYNFTVKATDLGDPPRSSSVKVALELVDINDNNPAFLNTTYYASVKENQPIGTSVITLTATDKDVGTNAKLIYGLIGTFTFKINETTGFVTTAEELDRERVSQYALQVRAKDSAVIALEGSTTLVVTVLDVNDHEPEFDKNNYAFDVNENVANGYSVGTVTAKDNDIGDNAVLTYSIVSGNDNTAFAINNATGEITTASKLDRETNSSFTLVIKAKDHGEPPKESNVTVTITILDYNDNAPQFNQGMYNRTIYESAPPGSQITVVQATDADKGQNAQFRYKIESGDEDNTFLLNEETGVMTLKGKLDHESKPTFKINVSAKDNGSPALKGYALAFITVLDVDDNAPEFTQSEYNAQVLENITLGSTVAQVNATDIDSAQAHSTIHYRFEGGNDDGMFFIGDLNGTVTLSCGSGTCLDRETKDKYILTVAAISMVNQTEQKTTVQLTITILDVNDDAPSFVTSPYIKQINEDIGDEIPGKEVIIVSATDKDVGSNAKIEYTMVSGNEKGYFKLNNETGLITTTKLLDREETSSFLLVVKATDKGVPPLSSTVNVSLSIKDINDNAPNFTKVGVEIFREVENITVGKTIAQFTATDKDEGKNAKITYRIISGDNEKAFVLNETDGTLKTAKELDHETTPEYQLIIQAQDGGNPSLTKQKEVKIIVLDVNDNNPEFTASTITLTVEENQPAGSVVGTIIAKDFDPSDRVYYYIIGGVNELFALDEDSGQITTKKLLDRENKATYILDIKASNYKLDPNTLLPRTRRRRSTSNSSSVPSAIQRVTIRIGDQNDNGPKFKNRLYTGGVSDSIKHGARALLVTATDADSGNNSRIAYSIDNTDFSVEKDTGWILAATSFAGQTGKEYTFTITAKDNYGGEPYFNDSTTVTIYILVDKQRAVLISGRKPEEVRLNKEEFKKVLENITGYIINIDDVNYYQDEQGNYDFSRTGVLFHAVDPQTNRIIDRDTLIRKIDQNYNKQQKFFGDWEIKGVKEYVPPEKKSSFDLKLVLAIAFGVLAVFLICIFCCVITVLRKRHKRKLRAAQAQTYGGGSSHVSRRSSMSTLPNTNLHNNEGSNPIWVDPYHNWGMDDDDDVKDFQTFKSNGSLSNGNANGGVNGGHFYSDIKMRPPSNNPLFESKQTYLDLDFDNNETADVDLGSTLGRSNGNRTPSPEPYESSPSSERNFYNNDNDKYQVTSI